MARDRFSLLHAMASSETPSVLDLTIPRRPDSTRRQVGSNIGLRRQRLVPQTITGTILQPNVRRDDGGGFQRFKLRAEEPQSRDKRHAPLKAVESRIRMTERGAISTIDSEPETFREDSSEKDSDSTLTILTNPDLDILPVAKTNQARASFDFCA